MAQRGTNIARYLTIAMVQGSADAFVQGSADTGIVPEDGLALRVMSMELVINASLQSVSADINI